MIVIEWILDKIVEFAQSLLNLLPKSPFIGFIKDFEKIPYLGWLNWLFPIGDMVIIGMAWLGVIGLFYGYQIIMRWIKVIGD